MSTPAMILLSLMMLSLGIAMEKHGTPRKSERHNVWPVVLAVCVELTLLYWGGFFSVHN
ncbi:MAG: hypothetical protein J0L84_18225 [Verrucomicrobia bacterium]|nr:hypothetical protein [Verrucomicrobiota bacterium]